VSTLKDYATPEDLHADLCLLVAWLAADGHEVAEIVDAIEKPWKWAAEIEAARACMAATR